MSGEEEIKNKIEFVVPLSGSVGIEGEGYFSFDSVFFQRTMEKQWQILVIGENFRGKKIRLEFDFLPKSNREEVVEKATKV